LLALFFAACVDPARSADGGGPAPPEASSWSPQAAPPSLGADGESRASFPAASADPAALAAILEAAPRREPASTGPDGGTLVGLETRRSTEALTEPPAAPAGPARQAPTAIVDTGEVLLEPGSSSPAIERAARAGLYWDLVHRCRERQGKLLPPDAVRLEFTVQGDGTVATSTILATSQEGRYDEAAQCMRRLLASGGFRVPAPADGVATRVVMTVPSVD
jgi:hypothetical protein